jgi:hypothetical protein
MIKRLRSETSCIVGIDVSRVDKFYLLARDGVRRHVEDFEAAIILRFIKFVTFVGRLLRGTY